MTSSAGCAGSVNFSGAPLCDLSLMKSNSLQSTLFVWILLMFEEEVLAEHPYFLSGFPNRLVCLSVGLAI